MRSVAPITPFRSFVALLFLVPAAAFAAGDIETPKTLAGGKVISVEEGSRLAAAKEALFVDTRSVVNFGKGRVPGAVAVAYKEKSEKVPDFDAAQDQFEMGRLPADRGARIVFYSDGPTGWKSFKAASMAVRAGYKNVMYMRGGFSDWVAKGLPQEK